MERSTVQRLAAALFLFLLCPAQAAAEARPRGPVPDQYLVGLTPGVAVPEVAAAHGLIPRHQYRHAWRGFAARIPEARLQRLRNDPRVMTIHADRFVSLSKPPCGTPPCGGGGGGGDDGGGGGEAPAQQTPTGIARINGPVSSSTAGVSVAVVDTGISDHADLNIRGGVNCSSGPASKYRDGNGHGTHVAGTIAALDNGIGVVGVAPGAGLYAVRVLNNAGSGFLSDVICGLDWVVANADLVDVANMSLGGTGQDGACADDPYHSAVCAVVAAGVTLVVAAGNDSEDAQTHVPATYEQVITVSALADFDGLPGGLAAATCRTDQDDTLADFSNYGADVDILAPGVCILSTWNDGGYQTISGTSMAAPHVAGAAALYRAANPGASPATVKAMLTAAGSYDWNAVDDPDGIQEPLLDISGF